MRILISKLPVHFKYVQFIVCQLHLKRGIGVVIASLKRRLIFQSHTDTCVDEMIPCLGCSSSQLGRRGRVVHRTGCAQVADSRSWTWAQRAVPPAFRVLQTSHNKAHESHAGALSFCSLSPLRHPMLKETDQTVWQVCRMRLQDVRLDRHRRHGVADNRGTDSACSTASLPRAPRGPPATKNPSPLHKIKAETFTAVRGPAHSL